MTGKLSIGILSTDVVDKRGRYIASCKSGLRSLERCEENAKFIVRACNAHEDLLEVLKEALWVHGTETKYLPDPEEHSWCVKARAVLAAAQA